MVQNLVNRCIRDHPDCASNSYEKVLPTRLIDVSPNDLGEDVRLLDTLHLPRLTEYIALSHVWGDIS
jgi:hypothetical protein